jgi:hypothetical protein
VQRKGRYTTPTTKTDPTEDVTRHVPAPVPVRLCVGGQETATTGIAGHVDRCMPHAVGHAPRACHGRLCHVAVLDRGTRPPTTI